MNVYLFSQKRAKLANFYFAINSSMESEPEPVSCVLSQYCTTRSIFDTVPVNLYSTDKTCPHDINLKEKDRSCRKVEMKKTHINSI